MIRQRVVINPNPNLRSLSVSTSAIDSSPEAIPDRRDVRSASSSLTAYEPSESSSDEDSPSPSAVPPRRNQGRQPPAPPPRVPANVPIPPQAVTNLYRQIYDVAKWL